MPAPESSSPAPAAEAAGAAYGLNPQAAIAALRSAGTAPRLTWYGEGERIELSGRVLLTWAAKVTGLLRDELDVQPGDRVLLDLPGGHWRTAYWALGAWQLGAPVITGTVDASSATVVVTTSGPRCVDALATGAEAVLVTLPALARRASVELPSGAIDEAAILNGQPDEAGAAYSWAAGEAAVASPDGMPADSPPVPAGARLWVPADLDPASVLSRLASIWSAAGSVVLADPGRGDLDDLLAKENAQRSR